MQTTQVCPNCGESIVFTEEVVLLQIVQPHIVDGQLLLHPVLGEDGDFIFEPYYVQFSPCWEEIEEWLEEEIEDTPPIEDQCSSLRCRYCRSGIRQWEFCGSLTMGEFRISERAPNRGVVEEAFVPAGEPDIICLYCLYLINEGNLEFWDAEMGGISQGGECGDCLQARCFRWTPGQCDCPCHADEELESDEQRE